MALPYPLVGTVPGGSQAIGRKRKRPWVQGEKPFPLLMCMTLVQSRERNHTIIGNRQTLIKIIITYNRGWE